MQHLIWVYTICLGPMYGTLGRGGLRTSKIGTPEIANSDKQVWSNSVDLDQAKQKKSRFRKPYFFGAYSKFFWDIQNFSSIFRVFLIIFMLFLYRKLKKKKFFLPTYQP